MRSSPRNPAKTWRDRPNGLRPDLAQLIADLKPGFVRWPGGCFAEGINVESRPQWKRSIGRLEDRTGAHRQPVDRVVAAAGEAPPARHPVAPVDGDRGRFAERHPGLLRASGWSHHPYELARAPSTRPGDPDWFTIAMSSSVNAIAWDGVSRRMSSAMKSLRVVLASTIALIRFCGTSW